MNIHVPMTFESVVELRFLTSVPTQIVSPQASKPIIGLIQDSLLGTYFLSQQTNLTYQEVMKLICSVYAVSDLLPSPDKTSPKGLTWTGSQILSQFLPKITYDKKIKVNDTLFNHVKIDNGHMVSGILDKDTVAKKSGGLIHITWNDHHDRVSRFP